MLNDSVPMRIHWPRHADLRLNNMLYRPYARNSNAKLGANARDEPASIGVMCSQVRSFFLLPSLVSMNPVLNHRFLFTLLNVLGGF